MLPAFYTREQIHLRRKSLHQRIKSEADMQEGHIYSRRALLLAPLRSYKENAAASQVVAGQEAPAADVVNDSGGSGSSFDANVVMILAVLLCALICALGLNSIVRCALRCSSRMSPGGEQQQTAEPGLSVTARLAQARARRKALRAMPTIVYSAGLLPLHAAGGGGGPVCAICLADLEPGERVRVLPKCNHGFHVRCVDRWLLARSTCPTCRQSLFGSPQKGSGCVEAEAGAEPPVRAFLVPLRPEGFIAPYDF
ncbi:RING-H2 finger protein ATL72-like [Phragmites australis]|uniref:RING-H2 finger protein ATL72-like n=1 Tax=Phragmites australis TaxID=29695 RepID=UPI002D775EB7|nr:RING-H2 finger protein ATL72-like [Phragmites australis]